MANQQIHTIYKKADGTRVPSVTTYLGILNKPALIDWAWQLGVQGLDYRKVRDQAGDTGTLVHYLILCKIKGIEPDLSIYTPQDIACASSPMTKFEDWRKQHSVCPIAMEVPFISEVYSFGGTPDFYGLLDDVPTLIDFKTSRAVYMENFCQLAAYKVLLEEQGQLVEQVRLLRVGKSEDEGFEERSAGNLDNHWKMFLACQQIYELQKQIRKTGREKD